MPRDNRAGCILINKDNKILVVHNIASNFWGFPKGRREKNETNIIAAMRELFEETGRSLDLSTLITYFTARKGCLFVAVGNFSSACVVDGIEIDQYDWITLDDLKTRNTSKFTQAFFTKIESVMKNIKK